MPGMFELPPLPEDVVADREPTLRLRHAITNTNYYVRIFRPADRHDRTLRDAIPVADRSLHWIPTRKLAAYPLTGLARKVLQRLDIMKPSLPPNEVHLPHPAAD